MLRSPWIGSGLAPSMWERRWDSLDVELGLRPARQLSRVERTWDGARAAWLAATVPRGTSSARAELGTQVKRR